jgi:hypothetical protein
MLVNLLDLDTLLDKYNSLKMLKLFMDLNISLDMFFHRPNATTIITQR